MHTGAGSYASTSAAAPSSGSVAISDRRREDMRVRRLRRLCGMQCADENHDADHPTYANTHDSPLRTCRKRTQERRPPLYIGVVATQLTFGRL